MKGKDFMEKLCCRKCGAELLSKITENQYICEYCGNRQSVIDVADEEIKKMFFCADEFRRNYDFQRAMILYERILEKFPNNPEANWGMALSYYGITYVNDIGNNEMVPTCNSGSIGSISENIYYLTAYEYASDDMRSIYKTDANYIDDIFRKNNLLSSETYDIYICCNDMEKHSAGYKKAFELYDNFINMGYKVFFPIISLEGRKRKECEPEVYSALQSSKVMLLVASNEQDIQSPWIKNEWSRYKALAGIRNYKHLYICYHGISNFPKELTVTLKIDYMEKDFLQRVLHEVKRFFSRNEKNISEFQAKAQSKLYRAVICLENSEFEQAIQFLEELLDEDPENSEAYWNNMLAKLNCCDESELCNEENIKDMFCRLRYVLEGDRKKIYKEIDFELFKKVFEKFLNSTSRKKEPYYDYRNAIDFAIDSDITKYETALRKAHESFKLYQIKEYEKHADYLFETGKLNEAYENYSDIINYCNSIGASVNDNVNEKIKKCEKFLQDEQEAKNKIKYDEACEIINNANSFNNKKDKLNEVLLKFKELGDYRDSKQKAEQIKTQCSLIDFELKKRKERQKKILLILNVIGSIMCVVITIIFSVFSIIGYKEEKTNFIVQWKSFYSVFKCYMILCSAGYGLFAAFTNIVIIFIMLIALALSDLFLIINHHIGDTMLISIVCLMITVGLASFISDELM